ncbi:MAG: hypothetical protein HQL68_01280 [Magnetococcales bacterium]|nr:hypothetical protein [Magnetococcales bacterium]
MVNFMVSTGFLFVLVLSLYGWGRFLLHRLLPEFSFGWAYCASFGMSFWLFLGGVLNLFAIARPPALWSVLVVGLLFSMYLHIGHASKLFGGNLSLSGMTSYLAQKRDSQPHWRGFVVLNCSLLALLFFYIYTLMPTSVFTPYDDFMVYLYRPLHMLGSGTFETNNPFSILPMDSLGGQAYMQAFFLLVFDINYINGFDVIICFFLSIALVIELGKEIKVPFKILLSGVLLLVVWHPIFNNISTVYPATLFILGAVFGLIKWYRQLESNPSFLKQMAILLPVAFFISATLTLKATMVIYIIMFFFVDFLLGLLFVLKRKPFVVSYASFGFAVVFLVLPWLLVYREKVELILLSLSRGGDASSLVAPKSSLWTLFQFSNLHLYWGGRLYWYLVIFLLMTATVYIALYLLAKNRRESGSTLWTIPLLSLFLSLTLFYFLAPVAFTWGYMVQHIVRYTTPVLLAAVPLLPFMLYTIHSSVSKGQLAKSPRFSTFIRDGFVPFAQMLLILYIGMFSVLFIDRIHRLNNYGTMLAYLSKGALKITVPKILALNSQEQKNEIKSIQAKVPKGEKILALIIAPFHLDYARNRIETVAKLDMVWNQTLGDDIETVLQTLKKRGIGYILWQYDKYPLRDKQSYSRGANSLDKRNNFEGQYGLYLLDTLETLKNRGEVLYFNEENKMVLFKLELL